jgi:hypothetical protein
LVAVWKVKEVAAGPDTSFNRTEGEMLQILLGLELQRESAPAEVIQSVRDGVGEAPGKDSISVQKYNSFGGAMLKPMGALDRATAARVEHASTTTESTGFGAIIRIAIDNKHFRGAASNAGGNGMRYVLLLVQCGYHNAHRVFCAFAARGGGHPDVGAAAEPNERGRKVIPRKQKCNKSGASRTHISAEARQG